MHAIKENIQRPLRLPQGHWQFATPKSIFSNTSPCVTLLNIQQHKIFSTHSPPPSLLNIAGKFSLFQKIKSIFSNTEKKNDHFFFKKSPKFNNTHTTQNIRMCCQISETRFRWYKAYFVLLNIQSSKQHIFTNTTTKLNFHIMYTMSWLFYSIYERMKFIYRCVCTILRSPTQGLHNAIRCKITIWT